MYNITLSISSTVYLFMKLKIYYSTQVWSLTVLDMVISLIRRDTKILICEFFFLISLIKKTSALSQSSFKKDVNFFF